MENVFIVNQVTNQIGREVARELVHEMSSDGITWFNELGFDEVFIEWLNTSQANVVVQNRSTLLDMFGDDLDGDDGRGGRGGKDIRGDEFKNDVTDFLGTMSKSAAQRYFKVSAKDERYNLTSKELGDLYGIETKGKTEKEIFNILASFNLFK